MTVIESDEKLESRAAGPSLKQVAASGVIGSILEWYDFYAYGTAATIVFPMLFFPSVDPAIGTLAAFATFGLGFFARPVGGIIFAHFGDRVGRKSVLMLTLIIMGSATALIGLLPTYSQVGYFAPALLVLLRLAQGFAAGAELGGASLMAVEQAPPRRRGLFGSLPTIGVVGGLLLASGAFALVRLLPDEQFTAWGWRLPFLVSIGLILVGIYVRKRVQESPNFLKNKEVHADARVPAKEVLATQRKSLFVVLGATIGENGVFYILSVFLLSYVTTGFGYSQGTGLVGISIAAAVSAFSIPFFGSLTDRVGRRPVFLCGAIFSVLFAFPLFLLGSTGITTVLYIAISIGMALGWGAMTGAKGAFYAELFPARMRFSGWSLGREVGSVLAGGFAPFISAALVLWAGGSWWPVAIYMVVLASVSVVAVALAPETSRRDISK